MHRQRMYLGFAYFPPLPCRGRRKKKKKKTSLLRFSFIRHVLSRSIPSSSGFLNTRKKRRSRLALSRLKGTENCERDFGIKEEEMINKVVHDTHKSGERPGLWKILFFSPTSWQVWHSKVPTLTKRVETQSHLISQLKKGLKKNGGNYVGWRLRQSPTVSCYLCTTRRFQFSE